MLNKWFLITVRQLHVLRYYTRTSTPLKLVCTKQQFVCVDGACCRQLWGNDSTLSIVPIVVVYLSMYVDITTSSSSHETTPTTALEELMALYDFLKNV